MVNAATGWAWTPDDLLATGRRIFDLKRGINLALGVAGVDDALPPRLLTHPRPSGSAAGNLPDLDDMLEHYYRLRGWDDEGRPQ
jgi:aldehyde:ferredoxin oxidoreductase